MAIPTTGSTAQHETISALLETALEEGRFTLPVMPDVAIRVNEAVRSRDVGARDLARIIEASPGLSARNLKTSNSAMYAGLSEIRDLGQAIGRLGTTMVLAIVIGAAGKETFRSSDPDWSALLETSWMGAVFSSVACRQLGVQAGETCDEYFLAGLLRGVGEPILVQTAEYLYKAKTMSRVSAWELKQAIMPLIPRAGARLLASWGIPDGVVLAIENQIQPENAPPGSRTMAASAGLSGEFGVRQAQGSDPVQSAGELVHHPTAEYLGLDLEALEPIFVQAAQDGMTIALAF